MDKKKIQKIIVRLKKENTRSYNKAKKENVMTEWSLEKVKRIVEIYLDAVLRLCDANLKQGEQDGN